MKATKRNAEKKIKRTVELPLSIYEQLQETAAKYHRSFNGELVFAIEQYLTYWYRPANEPPQQK
jgi:hypothetical protein